ncbi:MAG: hypothetical protein F6K10_24875 [Moorea sp. SIO2B7]|nr:hypothetical protein [Moorena sp. SIO2B7]
MSKEKRCRDPVDPDGFMVETARYLGIYLGEISEQAVVIPSLSSEKYQ